MKRLLLLSFLLLLFSHSFSTTYYVSNAGNDANAGTSTAAPWKTIAKLNTHISALKPGDNVLFRRGDVFTGQILLTVSGGLNNPITFGAYDTGADPVISGMVPITNWKLHQGNIWYAASSTKVPYLYVNDKFMTLARYPNSGYILVNTATVNNVNSKSITQANDYWKGSNVRLRTTKWTWEYKEVASSTSSGTINFVGSNKYIPEAGYGFFLDGKLEQLDMETEWAYDAASGRVYLWAPNGANPNNLLVEGSTIDYGIYAAVEEANITVRDLTFRGQKIDGVYLFDRKSANNTITNCKFYDQGETSVSVGGANITVTNNYFEGARGRAVKGHEVKGGTFSHNIMRQIGRQNGYGISGNQGMNGFHFTMTDDVYVGYNRIDSVGYTGITVYASNSLVERNIVNASLLNLNDGGCIYTFSEQSHHTIIRENIVYNAIGNNDGVPAAKVKSAAFGIYIDNKSYNMSVLHNTILNSGTAGVFVNSGAHDVEVASNVIYGADRDLIQLEEKILPGQTIDNTFHDNVAISFNPDVACVRLLSEYGTHANLGTFENNYFYNLYSPYIARIGKLTNKPLYSMDQWENMLPTVINQNKISPFQWDWVTVASYLSNNLITNGTFTANASGWTTASGNAQTTWLTKGGMDGGCYELKMTGGSPATAAVSTNITGGLKSGTHYELKFSVLSTKYETLEVNVKGAGGKVLHTFDYPLSPTRHDFVKIIESNSNEATATVEFRVAYTNGHNFILDNVEVFEVNAIPYNPIVKAKIFVNQTAANKAFTLTGTYQDVDLNPVSGSITLAPFSSVVLFADSVSVVNTDPGHTNSNPVAVINATPITGTAPLLVDFDGTSSSDPDGLITNYTWDFGDGKTGTGNLLAHTYQSAGNYLATLTVQDDSGAVNTANVMIIVKEPATSSGCTLPSGWLNEDIGNVGFSGKACEDGTGVFTIEASGADIWDKIDAFQYVYKPMTGNGEIVMRVNALLETHAWAKSGLMMRESLDPGSKNAYTFIAASGRYTFQRRVNNGGLTTSTNSPKDTPIPIPYWVKLVRQDNMFRGYASPDGITWTLIDQEEIPMATEIFVGIAVTSHDDNLQTTSVVDNVTFTAEGVSSFPVELIHFDGRPVGEAVLLEWATASELNNAYFTIEKSLDGAIFEVLDQVQGMGISQEVAEYQLIDNQPNKGRSFYRLKQTDFDGTFRYLGTVEIFFDSELKPEVSIYPNPTYDHNLNLHFQGIDTEQILRVALLDVAGREVWVASEPAKSMQVSLPEAIPAGMYIMMVEFSDGLIGERLQIQ
ncbi:MAG: PKD domain-containing protein [Bacteroidia bacterium]